MYQMVGLLVFISEQFQRPPKVVPGACAPLAPLATPLMSVENVETVSCMQQLHESYASPTYHYIHALL